MDGHAQLLNPGGFLVHDVLGQAVRRNAVAQHAARRGHHLKDFHAVPAARQEIGGGQAGRARADDGHALAGGRGGLGHKGVPGGVGGKALELHDGQGAFQQIAPAFFLAGMGADPADAAGQRVILHDEAERLLELAVGNQADVALAVLVGGAAVAAGGTAVAPMVRKQ